MSRPAARRRGELGLFLGQLLRHPREVSAALPSSRALARAMAAAVPPAARRIAELGPGTGRITNALIERGVAPGDLWLFEVNGDFAAALAARYPGAHVVHGPAQQMARAAGAPFDAVVSGLPLLSMPQGVQEEILGAVLATLAPGGVLVQFTYGPGPSVTPALRALLGLEVVRAARIWANLPPARVHVFTRKSPAVCH